MLHRDSCLNAMQLELKGKLHKQSKKLKLSLFLKDLPVFIISEIYGNGKVSIILSQFNGCSVHLTLCLLRLRLMQPRLLF